MQKSMLGSQKNLQEQESQLKKVSSQLEKSSEEMAVLKEMLQVWICIYFRIFVILLIAMLLIGQGSF